MKKIRPIFILLFLALILRLFLLFPQYSGDVKNHFVWGNAMLVNPIGLYSQHFSGFNDINYPPLAIFLFGLSNLLLIWLNSIFSFLNRIITIFPSALVPLFNHENMQYGFLKLPGIIADLGVGYLIYQFTSKRFKHPLLLASLYLFNSAVIYLSSVWGQIEPVTNFFLLLSLLTVIDGKSSKVKPTSLIFFTLAVLTKQTALWFIPLYLFIWLKNLSRQEMIKGSIYSFVIFFVSYLPFGLSPINSITGYFSTLSGSSTVVSDAAWNFWYFLYPGGAEDSLRLGLFSIRSISIVILLSLLAGFLYKLTKNYSPKNFFKYLFIWSLAVFFLQTRVHERHLSTALVFGLLAFAETPLWWLSYLGLSLFHFLNLYLTLKIPFI